MASWLNESRFVRNMADNILAPKKTHYEDGIIQKKLNDLNHINHTAFTIKNEFGELLKVSVFENANTEPNYCILYLHGHASHRLQGLTILSSLPKAFSLCCFDFSGSGKSQGSISTYGIKQYQDIHFVIQKLKSLGYKEIILWGRSMGAVTSLLYTSLKNNQDVIFQVLDSPFSSFENIAHSFGKKQYNFPQIFIGFGINILKEHLRDHIFNPFLIDLPKIVPDCETPALFLYSEDDQIIPSENTQKIIDAFNPSTRYQKLIISESHNSVRSEVTLKNIINAVKKSTFRSKDRSCELFQNRKGLLEVMSSYKSKPKNRTDSDQRGKIRCSLSRQKFQGKILRIKTQNIEAPKRQTSKQKGNC